MTPPSLPLEVSVRLEAGPGAGRGSHPVLPPSGAVRGLHGQQEPHQHWNIQEALQAGSCGLRQTLPLQTAAPFEAVAASSSLLLPFSDSHRVPWDQSQTSSSQNKPRLPKSERGAVIPQGCSAAPACSTSVSWPQAMGSPWQPLLRSSSLMPGRSSHGCVFQGSRAEMGMERDGKGSELCPAPHANAGCGSKVLTHCLTLVLASVLRE